MIVNQHQDNVIVNFNQFNCQHYNGILVRRPIRERTWWRESSSVSRRNSERGKICDAAKTLQYGNCKDVDVGFSV